MAKFKLVLDKRVPLKDGKYNLAIRVSHKKAVMFLNLQKLTEQQYDIVFTKNSMDEKSVEFRKKCHGYIATCEEIYLNMEVFDKTKFRKKFYQEDDEGDSPDVKLNVKELFARYVKTCDNKPTTKEHYLMVGRIIDTYRPGATVNDINVDFLKGFRDYILSNGTNSPATVDSYMRNLRRIIRYFTFEEPLISKEYSYPFGRGKFVIGSYFPKKQVLTEKEIQSVLDFENFNEHNYEYVRDIWALLFYLNGMNMGDLMSLKKTDIQGKYIEYLRRKTLTTRKNNITPIIVPITPEVRTLFNRVEKNNNEYVLGLITPEYDEEMFKKRLKRFRRTTNKQLKCISEHLNLSTPLQLKTARDCYASTLLRNGISKDNISTMMGHSNSIVTEHYLASIDLEKTDDINSVLPRKKVKNQDDNKGLQELQ